MMNYPKCLPFTINVFTMSANCSSIPKAEQHYHRIFCNINQAIQPGRLAILIHQTTPDISGSTTRCLFSFWKHCLWFLISAADSYDFKFLVAVNIASAKFRVVAGGSGCTNYGKDLTGLVNVASTGGWFTFKSIAW